MKNEEWTLNMIHHMTFTMALYNVSEMFEETDDYPLARQVVLAGFVTEEEIEALLEKFYAHDLDKPIEMSFKDILLLYTGMDLNAKLLISHKGDKRREELKLDDTANADPMAAKGFEGLLAVSSIFVRNLIKEYEHIPAFKERMNQLDKLNAYI